jgi:hypothetical protein
MGNSLSHSPGANTPEHILECDSSATFDNDDDSDGKVGAPLFDGRTVA